MTTVRLRNDVLEVEIKTETPQPIETLLETARKELDALEEKFLSLRAKAISLEHTAEDDPSSLPEDMKIHKAASAGSPPIPADVGIRQGMMYA